MIRNQCIWLGLCVCIAVAGCSEPTERLNAPPQGEAEHTSDMTPFYTYMVDNGMQSDLSIADIHFVPHTSELNSLGAARLDRLGRLVEPYGGKIRYASTLSDENLVNQRVQHIRDYLVATGVDTARIDVIVAAEGSSFTPANEAIESKYKGMASKFEASEDSDQ